MTAFIVGKPLVTTDAYVAVDAGLPVGSHAFQLVVVTDQGVASAPCDLLVSVTDGKTDEIS
jgi:hypothetical protein